MCCHLASTITQGTIFHPPPLPPLLHLTPIGGSSSQRYLPSPRSSGSPCTCPGRAWGSPHNFRILGYSPRIWCPHHWWSFVSLFYTSRRPRWLWRRWTLKHIPALPPWRPWRFSRFRAGLSSWFGWCWRWAGIGSNYYLWIWGEREKSIKEVTFRCRANCSLANQNLELILWGMHSIIEGFNQGREMERVAG